MAQVVKNLPAMQGIWVRSLGWKDPLEKGMATHSSTHGVHGGSDGKESACNVGDLGLIPGLERSPGEGNDTHSSILAWRIPWIEEHEGLQSIGSQRVGHN